MIWCPQMTDGCHLQEVMNRPSETLMREWWRIRKGACFGYRGHLESYLRRHVVHRFPRSCV